MNTSVTLTAEEFKVLHNSLCELDRLAYHHHVPKVEEIVERIRKVALKSAYEQDNRAFEAKHDMFHNVKKQHGLKSTWSLYEVESMTQLHDYGPAEYVVYDEHWGGKEVVRRIDGHDWLALYRAADACIQASGDGHHAFIESFTPIKDKPGHLRLGTGS